MPETTSTNTAPDTRGRDARLTVKLLDIGLDLSGEATISVEKAGRLLGIGRSAAYEAVHRGEIPSVHIGRRYRVPVPRLLALLGAESAS